jgi:hypothetical protein
MKLLTMVVLFGMVTLGSTLMVAGDDTATTINNEAQIAKLFELEASFHGAVSVHNYVDGDSPEVVDQRIRKVLSLWAEDGTLDLESGTYEVNGWYVGRGNLDDPSTCQPPTTNYYDRGTLCTLYKYVASYFKPGAKLIALAPPYKTHFQVNGTTATVYFECHYFDVGIEPTTGKPLWKAKSHVDLDGSAIEINGQWFFWNAKATKVGVPVP